MYSIVTTALNCLLEFRRMTGDGLLSDPGIELDHAGFAGQGQALEAEMRGRMIEPVEFLAPEGSKIIAGAQKTLRGKSLGLEKFAPAANRRPFFEPMSFKGFSRLHGLALVAPGYQGMSDGCGYVAFATLDLNRVAGILWSQYAVAVERTTLYGYEALMIGLSNGCRVYITNRLLFKTLQKISI